MKVYIASPLFNEFEKSRNVGISEYLNSVGISTYLPQKDGGLAFDLIKAGEDKGKTRKDMFKILKRMHSFLPEEKPRHLLGIGRSEDLEHCVKLGMDLFDCVWPTRLARRGSLIVKSGRINIGNARYIKDFQPIEKGCHCYTCKNFTRAYISHLFRAKELLAYRLATIHNLYFTLKLMENIRNAI